MEPVTPATPSRRSWRRSKRHPHRLLLVQLAVLTLLNLALCSWIVFHRAAPTVSFDMKGTLDQFMAQAASQTLTEAQSAQLGERFSQALEASLADYQAEHRALILVSASVVGGAPDITPQIQHAIAKRMRSSPGAAPTQHEATAP